MTRPVVQQFAGHYIRNMTFPVVLLRSKEKRPRDDGWQQRQYHVEDFAPEHNIGLKTINGYVVADDDFETPAVACAKDFMPSTGAVYERASKPQAKRIYQCPDLTAPIVWKDLAGKTCFEIRVNHQDMLPPSTHPEGERLKWYGLLLPPREIKADHLIKLSRLYYTARLLAMHLPPEGARHDFRLAVARVLLDMLGIEDTLALKVLEWACRLGGSDHAGIADAATAIRSTRQGISARHASARQIPNMKGAKPAVDEQMVKG